MITRQSFAMPDCCSSSCLSTCLCFGQSRSGLLQLRIPCWQQLELQSEAEPEVGVLAVNPRPVLPSAPRF